MGTFTYADSVKALTAVPVKTCNMVFVLGSETPEPTVEKKKAPSLGATHLYQTVFPEFDGSPASAVAPVFVPVVEPDPPVMTDALAQLSFAGILVRGRRVKVHRLRSSRANASGLDAERQHLPIIRASSQGWFWIGWLM